MEKFPKNQIYKDKVRFLLWHVVRQFFFSSRFSDIFAIWIRIQEPSLHADPRDCLSVRYLSGVLVTHCLAMAFRRIPSSRNTILATYKQNTMLHHVGSWQKQKPDKSSLFASWSHWVHNSNKQPCCAEFLTRCYITYMYNDDAKWEFKTLKKHRIT